MGCSDAVLPADLQSSSPDFNLKRFECAVRLGVASCRRPIVGWLLTFGAAA